MASLLREMATRYSDRIIIFDSPPLLATTEARVLATNMGQIVMVVAADATSQHAVNQALATIESCEIVLMVLNKASRTDVGTYYGYYANDEPG
jgi:receptor protein-tyrosine kinase